jgi:hypothetical protein
MAGDFTLTITSEATTTSAFGETSMSERLEIVRLLQQVIQQVGSGSPSSHLIDAKGNDVGSYSYGVGMINAGA